MFDYFFSLCLFLGILCFYRTFFVSILFLSCSFLFFILFLSPFYFIFNLSLFFFSGDFYNTVNAVILHFFLIKGVPKTECSDHFKTLYEVLLVINFRVMTYVNFFLLKLSLSIICNIKKKIKKLIFKILTPGFRMSIKLI